MISDDLQKILDGDDSGLLDLPDKPAAQTSDERLVNSFLEIVSFYDENGHAPNGATTNILERRLYSRLDGIKADAKKRDVLKDFDKYDLLTPTEQLQSIDDILDSDSDLFDDDTGILTIKNIPKDRNLSDFTARRKPCKDFHKFEHKFAKCKEDLASGRRKLFPFKQESQIVEGRFFVASGITVYVDTIGKYEIVHGRYKARLRCIFENGTESNMYLRSLASELYVDGRIIAEPEENLLANFEGINLEDDESGYIYVLQSHSDNPEIKETTNLYKIGFSTQRVEDRIRGAVTDPTYLMAPVKIAASYKCYNMTTQKFEHLLHRFFVRARLELEVTDNLKERYVPDEWFIVPLDVIDQAITLVINGEIVNYRYDHIGQKIKLND